MADSTRIPGNQVKCHQCSNIWPRQQGGLQCPRCESEFVEILSDSTPPSPDLPSRPDILADRELTRTGPSDSRGHHNPRHGTPDPDEDAEDMGRFRFGIAPGSHRESRSSNGSAAFSFSMFGNERPMIITNNPARGGTSGRLDNAAMAQIQHEFEDLFQSMLGEEQRQRQHQRSPQNQGTMQGRPPPLFPFSPAGQQQPQGQVGNPWTELFHTLFQGFGVHIHAGADGNAGAFASFQRMMDPANAAHGDAVFSQEALDRVITELMEQNQVGNAPGPAPEAAIRALPKKKVEKDMLDDKGKAECSICMESVELGDQVTVLPCKHWFHEACITAWLKEHDTCPHCRKGIAAQSEANGNTSRGSGQPSRPPRRTSSGATPGCRQGSSGTARNPMVVDEMSPGRQDIRAARERYYSRQEAEDLERRDTQGRRSARPTPSSPNDRRRRSGSYRTSSNSDANNNGGGFGGWVRSFGGSGGEH